MELYGNRFDLLVITKSGQQMTQVDLGWISQVNHTVELFAVAQRLHPSGKTYDCIDRYVHIYIIMMKSIINTFFILLPCSHRVEPAEFSSQTAPAVVYHRHHQGLVVEPESHQSTNDRRQITNSHSGLPRPRAQPQPEISNSSNIELSFLSRMKRASNERYHQPFFDHHN